MMSGVVKFDPAGVLVNKLRNDCDLVNFPLLNFNSKIYLLTTYWDKNERSYEYKIAFEKNIANQIIEKIYIFYEKFSGVTPDFLRNPKICVVPIDHLPCHKDFYDFANKFLAGDIIVMANSDIFFDDTLNLLRYIDFDKSNVVLTRYPYQSAGRLSYADGSDSWIFRSPIKYQQGDYKIGVAGTEHALIGEWVKSGYNIVNPCLSITSWHVHKSTARSWDQVYTHAYFNVHLYLVPFLTLSEALAAIKMNKNTYF